eukprot:6499264-Prymnesium_polylepis.1
MAHQAGWDNKHRHNRPRPPVTSFRSGQAAAPAATVLQCPPFRWCRILGSRRSSRPVPLSDAALPMAAAHHAQTTR